MIQEVSSRMRALSAEDEFFSDDRGERVVSSFECYNIGRWASDGLCPRGYGFQSDYGLERPAKLEKLPDGALKPDDSSIIGQEAKSTRREMALAEIKRTDSKLVLISQTHPF
jgi:hypothetical protein